MWTLVKVEFAGLDARHEGIPLLLREMQNGAVRVGGIGQVHATVGRRGEEVLTHAVGRPRATAGCLRPVVAGERRPSLG